MLYEGMCVGNRVKSFVMEKREGNSRNSKLENIDFDPKNSRHNFSAATIHRVRV